MTKVSVLGGEPKRDLKKIELVRYVTSHVTCIEPASLPASNFKEIILIQTNAFTKVGYDLILAKSHDEDLLDSLYFGHWNDGVV